MTLRRKSVLFVSLLLGGYFIFPNKTFASQLRINEFSPHPSSGNHEWVEFYNPDHLDLSNYWIDDDIEFSSDNGSSPKKKLTVILGASTDYPYIENSSSMFNNSGDHVVLFDGDGNLVDDYKYDKDPGADKTIGRSPDGVGNFILLAGATKGSANSAPQPSPTDTPTPVKSELASKVTPTNTPTPSARQNIYPTATPTPTIKSAIASSVNHAQPSTVAVQKINSDIATVTLEPSLTATNSSQTAVLADATTPTPTHKPKVLVQAENQMNRFILPIIFAGSGLIFFSICGILFFRKWKSDDRIENS